MNQVSKRVVGTGVAAMIVVLAGFAWAVPARVAPAPAQAPSDAEIAHIALTANSIDSAMAELASSRAQSEDVKAFARMMIEDHGGVNKQAVALAGKLGLRPEPNAVSKQLQAGADEARAKIEPLSGAAFDKAYMDREVTYHQAVLDALDRTLVPNARNEELKSLLKTARGAVAAHLERARAIQGQLGD